MVAKRLVVGASVCGLVLTLGGCGTRGDSSGGGGGGSPGSPSPGPSGPAPSPSIPPAGPVECTDKMKRGHCTKCRSTGKEIVCDACSDPYNLNAAATNPDEVCVYDCGSFKVEATPPNPGLDVKKYNGVTWPGMCVDQSVSHFFTIGDWGGFFDWNNNNHVAPGEHGKSCSWLYTDRSGDHSLPDRPCPMPNRGGGHGPWIAPIEGRVQSLVANRMKDIYTELGPLAPKFVINVGDNFYPGGIDTHCGANDLYKVQFEQVWKAVYPAPLTDIPWMGVLGNHDYGGVCFLKGWDQQIRYTWEDKNWVMPGQYFKRSVQYKNFALDMFFVDGNIYDASMSVGASHNICNPAANPGQHCETQYWPPNGNTAVDGCGAVGPRNKGECEQWFKDLWNDNYKFLTAEVPKSTADWQFVVNHYPAVYNLGTGGKDFIEWSTWLPKNGIDLFIAGHTHEQKVYYHSPKPENMGDTAWVVTGGGGGVSAEALPMPGGDDDSYGFMDVEISLHTLTIKAYSHGGVGEKKILRNETVVYPVAAKKPTPEQLVAAVV